MSNGIYLIGRGKVNDGSIEPAQAALSGVIKNVQKNNLGVEFYEHALDTKTGVWTGVEKYADSEVLKAHITDPVVGEGLGRFMAYIDFEGVVVMGDVSAEVKEMMVPFNPTYLGTRVGFSRAAAIV